MKKICFYLLSLLIVFTSCSSGGDEESLSMPSIDGSTGTEFKRIPAEDLQGWDDGLYSTDTYILVSYDKENDYTRYYISDFSNATKCGLSFILDNESKVIEVSNENICVNVTHSNEGNLFSWLDTSNQLNGFFVKGGDASESVSMTRANLSDFFSLANVESMYDVLGKIADAGTLAADLFNADTYKFLNDLKNIAANGTVGLLPFPLSATIASLKAIIDGSTNSLYKRQRKAMYGDCAIKIEEISNDGNGNINVFVTIENANTVPSHLYHLYYTESESVARNIVYWGVVGKEGSIPYLNWCSEPYNFEDLLDCSISSPQYKMLTFEMPRNSGKYYFRAYLKSLRLKDANNNVNDNHIKYSEKYEYNALDAYITKFEQESQQRNGGDITFKCTVSGYISSLDNLIEWGIYYLDDKNNYTYFPSKFALGYTPPEGMSSIPNTDDVEIEISLKTISFINGYKDVKLGIYTKGGFYLGYNGWSEPQTYTLKMDEACHDENHVHAVDLGLPSGLKWACCNVGATTPEEYGGYYAWGETEEKSYYDMDTYKYWSDKNGDGHWEYNEFVNLGNDISGTQYDVATVKWGGTWRMPTRAEQDELRNSCTWTWTTLNGVTGNRVTGPNGNSIFLPAAGWREGTEVTNQGVGGYYRSSSLDSSSIDVYYMIFGGSPDWSYCCYHFIGHSVRPVCP